MGAKLESEATLPASILEPGKMVDTHLKGFRLVWYDPQVNGKSNKKYQKELVTLFASCSFCDNPKDAIHEFSSPSPIPLTTVVISNGNNYPDVREAAESAAEVCGILIFCFNLEKYEHYKKESKKVLAVSNHFHELKGELKKVHSLNQRIRRFFEVREEQAFYTLKDAEVIKTALSQRVENEVCTIFFPIGFKGVDISSVLTPAKLEEILFVAKHDDCLAPYLCDIQERISALKSCPDMQTVIASFTENGLRNVLDLYIRYGYSEGLKLFREYLFCLKGSLIELGEPIPAATTVLYRGMSLSQKDLQRWAEAGNSERERYGLFPSLTSTTADEKIADEFINIQRGKDKTHHMVKLSMKLTDEAGPFSEFLREFNFAEDCGLFYPCDVSKYSAFREEKEVLFPPFYPFKIVGIAPEKDGVIRIDLLVPRSVCVSTIKNATAKLLMGSAEDAWADEYLRKVCDLVGRGLSSDLSFCIVVCATR